MNIREQTEPGPGGGGVLATATLDDLIREIKARCVALAIVMVVEDEDGDDITVTKTLGSQLVMLGACREVEYRILKTRESDDDD